MSNDVQGTKLCVCVMLITRATLQLQQKSANGELLVMVMAMRLAPPVVAREKGASERESDG